MFVKQETRGKEDEYDRDHIFFSFFFFLNKAYNVYLAHVGPGLDGALRGEGLRFVVCLLQSLRP